jgi:hypothetical protein
VKPIDRSQLSIITATNDAKAGRLPTFAGFKGRMWINPALSDELSACAEVGG